MREYVYRKGNTEYEEVGHKMEKNDVIKMMMLLSTDEKSNEDIRFISNNLQGFQTFLFNMTTHELIQDGVPAEKVEIMLEPLIEVTKMLGANEYQDFLTVGRMFEEEGI